MITLIKDIYQNLSTHKHLSIIDIFISLVIIHITNELFDIKRYFTSFLKGDLISSVSSVLLGIYYCVHVSIIILFIISFISLIIYYLLDRFYSGKNNRIMNIEHDMYYTLNRSSCFTITLFFYMVSIGLFLELVSDFSLYNYFQNLLNGSPLQQLSCLPFSILCITALLEIYDRYFRAKVTYNRPSKITVSKPIEVKIIKNDK